MLAERIEAKWVDAFEAVFARCALQPGDVVAILSETQSRAPRVPRKARAPWATRKISAGAAIDAFIAAGTVRRYAFLQPTNSPMGWGGFAYDSRCLTGFP